MKALKHIILLLIIFSVFLAILIPLTSKHIQKQKQSVIDSLKCELRQKQLEVDSWNNIYIEQVQKTNFWKNYKK